MYKITLIPKQSTMDDIRRPWIDSGRDWNGDDGEFVFNDIIDANLEGATLKIIAKNGNLYMYNMIDFYRVKMEEVK